VVNGPDLSFESETAEFLHLDTYGHGTHMAGIIAGRDDSVTTVDKGIHDQFLGIAPDAGIVNIKVADSSGAVDVSQVIAAIDWVVQHRNDDGLNIRVLNLSFGTDGVQSYVLVPLTYATEVAWRNGIVVVVAAGNGGFGTTKLNNPAYDPFVIAVGGADGQGTYGIADDTIPSWSSCGDGTRNPDLVAPGRSIVSLRAPGSTADLDHPEGFVNGRFFRGSGTSQAAAVVSGAAALVLEQRPGITPDQLKALLMSTAAPLPAASARCQGAGMLDLKLARQTPTPLAVQTYLPATGLGSLELARGSAHLVDNGNALLGERDIFGTRWDAARWAAKSWSGTSWSGGNWNGKSWSGSTWSASGWSAKSWSGVDWYAKSWSDASWTAKSWSGKSWSSLGWSAKSWSGASWTGGAWTSNGWLAKSWSTNLWSSGAWS
jgi:serine protease AprX